MGIKAKFYIYFLVTILLSPLLLLEVVLAFSNGNLVDIFLVIVILLIYLGLYLAIRKDFLMPFSELQDWVKRFKFNQNVRLDDEHNTTFQPVAKAINHLIDENRPYQKKSSLLKASHQLN